MSTAIKLTQDQIEAQVSKVDYYIFPGTTLTVCCVTLINGYTVTGESACVDPANFNETLGQQIALKAAKEKIWNLEGYLLKQKMFNVLMNQ